MGIPLAQTAEFLEIEKMEKLALSVNLINAILQYLDSRPHNEVRRLIDAIQAEAQQATQGAPVATEADQAQPE